MTRKDAIEHIKMLFSKGLYTSLSNKTKEAFDILIPELHESEDDRIRKRIVWLLNSYIGKWDYPETKEECLAYLEKQKEQKPSMIQWKGDNLKEVIDFTGKSPMFDKWFKSFEEYEGYVHSHDNIFKLFNDDGSHYEVSVGAWIVKTPDGCNVASKTVFKQKPAEWSEEDEVMLKEIIAFFKDGSVKLQHDLDLYAGFLEKRLKSLRPSWKPSEQEKSALRTAIYVLTEERCFPKTAAQLQNILDAFNGEESSKDWKPSEEQMGELSKVRTLNPGLDALYQQLKNM